MKIGFFHHTLRLGSGIDTVIYELANRVAKKEDVTVFCFKSEYKQEDCRFRIQEVKSPFANTPTKMMTVAPFILDKVGELKSELRNFDVINTQHYPANYIVRNIHGPLKLVTEWSAVKPTMFSSFKEKLYVKWSAHANRVAATKADVVIAPCEFVRKWIIDNYSIDPVTMFLDGVNFDIFNRARVKPDRVYQLHPSLEGKKIVLFVGRITESKNIQTLIEAFAKVRTQLSDAVLLLVGDYNSYQDYYSRLLELVRARGLEDSVIFTGVASWKDLPSYFAASSVYATTSLWEGFLRAEAFAFGKPIVCFNVAANSETVVEGKTGFLIENLDADIFATKMYELLANDSLARNLGENGYKWAKQNLDFDMISEKFITFCSEKLQQQKPLSVDSALR